IGGKGTDCTQHKNSGWIYCNYYSTLHKSHYEISFRMHQHINELTMWFYSDTKMTKITLFARNR
ncbi:hypothetical protein ACQP3C_28635, partial [Escherichia coli]